MTCFQWFLDSLQNPVQFWNSMVNWDGFRNTLDFSFGSKLSRLDWQSPEIPWTRSCLDFGLREYTIKFFEATRDNRRECPDMQSRPHWYSELVVSVLLNRDKSPTAFASVLFELIAEVKTEHLSCRREGHVALETRTSSEVETRLSFIEATRTSK